jgi:predicted  nucleic acid-binding Zn-ribbon protein
MFWRISKGLRQLEERMDALERDQKALEVEWTEVYDKVRHTLSRISKRSERVIQAEQEPEPSTSRFPVTDPISQQIIARRRRLGGAGGTE